MSSRPKERRSTASGSRNVDRRVRAHAADEHVMAPDEESQQTDREDRKHHRAIAEDGLASKGRKNVRGRAHAGQDRDVNFRMTKEPEQMLPENRRAAGVTGSLDTPTEPLTYRPPGMKKLVPAIRSSSKKNSAAEQHRKRKQSQHRRGKPGPAGERHAHQRHSFGAHVEQCSDEVKCAQQ